MKKFIKNAHSSRLWLFLFVLGIFTFKASYAQLIREDDSIFVAQPKVPVKAYAFDLS